MSDGGFLRDPEERSGRKVLKACPKEFALSDAIKEHLIDDLRDRLICVSREPQITRHKEVDLLVETIRLLDSGREEHYQVIIEVKGNWNPNLETDIEKQLANKYLKNNPQCRHGIYLVGWYNCLRWDSGDLEKRVHTKIGGMTQSQASHLLEAKAMALSTEDMIVRSVVLDTTWHK